MITIQIKPLSVNKAWKGVRYKTNDYIRFENNCLLLLPKITLPEPPFEIHLEFGFSSKGSDWDNPTKNFVDILSKKYHFNDSLIYRGIIEKVIVPKGKEYIKFEIKTLTKKATLSLLLNISCKYLKTKASKSGICIS